VLDEALNRSDGAKGGRPAYDSLMMFKILILQALNGLSDERAEFLITDRLSYMRFLGLSLGDKAPDRNTIWTFREALKGAGVMDDLFTAFDEQITRAGYHATHGQLVGASLISAPKQRLTDNEKAAIKQGKSAEEIWDNPHEAAQRDVEARWTIKYSRKKEGAPKGQVDIAIPSYGYKSHIMIDRWPKNCQYRDKIRHPLKIITKSLSYWSCPGVFKLSIDENDVERILKIANKIETSSGVG